MYESILITILPSKELGKSNQKVIVIVWTVIIPIHLIIVQAMAIIISIIKTLKENNSFKSHK
jgi:hypothetical protein